MWKIGYHSLSAHLLCVIRSFRVLRFIFFHDDRTQRAPNLFLLSSYSFFSLAFTHLFFSLVDDEDDKKTELNP